MTETSKSVATEKGSESILEGRYHFPSNQYKGLTAFATAEGSLIYLDSRWDIKKIQPEPPKPTLYERIQALPVGTAFHLEEPTGRKFWALVRGEDNTILSATRGGPITISPGYFDENDILVVDYQPEN